MTTPTVEYRGHIIRWSDNEDKWSCMDLGRNSSNASLAKMKAAIDRLYLAERKQAATSCFEICNHDASCRPAQVIEYLGSRTERWAQTPKEIHKVASVATRNRGERPSRAEKQLTDLMPDTPEAHAAFKVYVEFDRQQREAYERARQAFAAIPRLTTDHIQPLIELYKRDNA